MSSDILQHFADKLHTAGLVVDNIEVDGVLHRCGVGDKPNGKDGAYKAFLDAPPSLWWQNWQTGESGTWCEKSGKDMTVTEREALKKRITEARVAAEQEKTERHAAAAQKAVRLWQSAKPAAPDHPYLTRKGLPPLGIRQLDESLVVPVLAEDGTLMSLQFILPDGGKRFLSGGKTEGGFFSIPAKDGGKDGTLLIAEGYATCASLHEATGYSVLVAFNAGNLGHVAKLARRLYPERELMLCADNDVTTEGNPGVTKATQAAAATEAKRAICPAHEGRATDFNDLHQLRSLEAVRQVVEVARKEPDACPMPEGFFLIPEGKRAGLYRQETKADGDSNEIRLGPPLLVRGMTRDADSNAWGLMLEWRDPDGRLHTWAMPLELLSKQGNEWFGMLADGGWLGVPAFKGKLARFLSEVRPNKRIRCVPRVGWHGNAFVLPDVVFGAAADEDVVLQSATHANLYGTGGTLEGWQEMASLAVGNSRLELALCAAFAGSLLALAGLESGGFNLVGGSSTGKSTSLRLAASVWDSQAYIRSWRATDNALEGLATLHNDTLLILDELGMASAKTVSEAAYMLTNGQGKARSNRDGSTRKSHTWRLLFLSSGEVGLADKLTEIGLKPRAGQEVRLVDIPADAGAGMGVFEELHGFPDAGSFASRIKELTETHYGHAGRAFLQQLVVDREVIVEQVRPSLAALIDRFCPADADGQVRRIAARFAVCAAAGELAKQAGVLPSELDAMGCAERCFHDWLNQRGGAGASEDTAILSAVRLFIEQHGASRFQDTTNPAATCINRVGFRQTNGAGRTEYIVLPESFKSEMARGCNPTKAARVLATAGWLSCDGERLTTKRLVPDLGRVRCYVLLVPEGDTDHA